MVGVAPAIPRCGEMGGIGRWGLIAEGRVRAVTVEVSDPAGEDGAGVVEAEEHGFIQEFVPQPSLEALADPVLHRPAWRDEVPSHLVLVHPSQHRIRGELGSVIGDDDLGPAAPGDQVRELARDPFARDRRVGDRRQTLLGDIIKDVQDAKAPAAGHLVVDEVDRPAGIWVCGPGQRGS